MPEKRRNINTVPEEDEPLLGEKLTTVQKVKNFVAKNKESLYLTLLLVVLVLARSIDYVLYVRMAKDMKNYAWFLGSIALPAAFVIVSWPIVWYKMKFTDHITPEMRKTPMKYYLILGGFDAFQNILSAIPAPFIPGPLQVVVSQLAIPINMGMSFLFLSTR
eukprot:Colp12_sorted_trinity150504_noHs@10440